MNDAERTEVTHEPPAGRIAIIVLGMHRSGTSALTRMLSLLGAHLPEHLLGANPTNKAGHWEPERLVNLHDQMLGEAGSCWYDWRAFDPGALPPGRLDHYRAEIARIIAEEYGDAPLIVLKDPRICRFVPLYETILADMGIAPRYVLVQRNPLGVIASLSTRDGMTPAYAGLLWLRHVLDGEAETRGRPRVFLSYEDFLDDWREAARRMSEGLALAWPRAPEEAAGDIEDHLTRDLQHHAPTPAELDCDPNVTDWIKETYRARLKLTVAENDPDALAKLGHIRNEFDRASPLFGAAAIPELIARERRLAEARQHIARGDEARKKDIEQLARLFAEARSHIEMGDGGMGTVGSKKAERSRPKHVEESASGSPMEAIVREFSLTREWFMDQVAEAKRQADEAKKQAEQAMAEAERSAVAAEARSHDLERRLSEAEIEARAAEEALSAKTEAYKMQADAVDRERQRGELEEKRLHEILNAVYASTSWRITKPLRAIGLVARSGRSTCKRGILRISYDVYRRLPLSARTRERIKINILGKEKINIVTTMVSIIAKKDDKLYIRDHLSLEESKKIISILDRIFNFVAINGKINYIFTLPLLSRGGSELVLSNYISFLRKINKGPFLIILTDRKGCDGGLKCDESDCMVINIIDFFPNSNSNDRVRILYRIIQAIRPKVFHNINSDIGWILIRDIGIEIKNYTKIFVSIFALQFEQKSNKKIGYAEMYLKDSWENISWLFTDNKRFSSDAINYYISPDDKDRIAVHYNPVRPIENPDKEIECNATYSDKSFNVLWAGRFDEEKRIDLLLEIAETMSFATFHVFGQRVVDQGDEFAKSAVSDNMIFYGPFEDLSDIRQYGPFDAFLFTSRWEGMPNILLEIAELEIPIVAAAVGGVPELITAETGYPVEAGASCSEYREQLERIRSNSSEAQQRAVALSKLVRSRHSREEFERSMTEVKAYWE